MISKNQYQASKVRNNVGSVPINGHQDDEIRPDSSKVRMK